MTPFRVVCTEVLLTLIKLESQLLITWRLWLPPIFEGIGNSIISAKAACSRTQAANAARLSRRSP